MTEFSRQKYDLAYEGMRPKQQPLCTMNDPCLITAMLEINVR